MVYLQQQGLLQVSGKQAASFLQGQITADIQAIDQGHCPLTAICNAKGRVLYTLRVIPHQSDYLLLLPKVMLEPAIHDLQKYARLSRVSLSEVSDAYKILGLNATPAPIQQHLTNIPTDNDRLITQADIVFITLKNPIPRLLAIVPAQQVPFLDNLNMDKINDMQWDVMDIQAGLPSISLASQGLFTPHELKLPDLNGVSFSKGCYIGQEIVARMQYLGKLKQHVFRAWLDTETLALPGSVLQDPNGLEIGQIVNCVEDIAKPKRYLVLLVMNVQQAQQAEWQVQAPFTGSLRVIYDIQSELNSN